MDREDLRTLTLSWLDDVEAQYFTPAQVNFWLNNAQKEVQKQLIQAGENWYVIKTTSSTVADTESYVLPDDFLKVHKLQVTVSGSGTSATKNTLKSVTLMQLDQVSTGTGTPNAYCLKKDCIMMRPIPDRIYPVEMFYSYRVADMDDDADIPDVPQQYQEYISVLAAIDGFLKDQRDPSPMYAKRDMYLKMMKQDQQSRTVDYPRMVRETDSDSVGFFY